MPAPLLGALAKNVLPMLPSLLPQGGGQQGGGMPLPPGLAMFLQATQGKPQGQ